MNPYAPNPPRIGAAHIQFPLSCVLALIFAVLRLQASALQEAAAPDPVRQVASSASRVDPYDEVSRF